MKKYSFCLLALINAASVIAQSEGSYTAFIQQDTAIKWAAACDKVMNLTPKIQSYSLKNWYLDKIRKGEAIAYRVNDDKLYSYQLSIPSLEVQPWLKGLSIELPPYKNPKEWFFFDKTIPKENYERYKYRVGSKDFSADSCCGCDAADAFRAEQVLTYSNGKFSICNVFISPLCARQSGTVPLEWYPLCNVAYNNDAERKFPGLSKDVILLNTDEVEYDFNTTEPSSHDKVLTTYGTGIGSLIYQDVLNGKIKPVETETGKPIPAKKFLAWKMPTDTITVIDPNDISKVTAYKVVQAERSPAGLNHIRIRQELYFDLKNERLYSLIKWIEIMEDVRMPGSGAIIGKRSFCKIIY